MTPTPDELALLRAIAARPDDDTPRLVLADMLDEHAGLVDCPACCGTGHPAPTVADMPKVVERRLPDGRIERVAVLEPFDYRVPRCKGCGGEGRVSDGRAERAEFLRLQIRIAAIQADCLCGACVRLRGGGQHHNGPCAVDRERVELPDGGSRQAFLRRRERELFAAHGAAWFGPAGCLTPPSDRERQSGGEWRVVSRGFVGAVSGPLAAFWGERQCDNCEGEGRVETGMRENEYGPCPDCGGQFEPRDDWTDPGYSPGTGRVAGPAPAFVELVRREPVTKVTVTGLEPSQAYGGRCWFVGSRTDADVLPAPLWDALPGWQDAGERSAKRYPTQADALSAASAALLSLARPAEARA